MAEIDLILPTRDDIASDFRDSWQARGASATPPRVIDVSEGTMPYRIGEAVADIALPFYANDNTIAQSFVVRGMTGDRLERYARERLEANADGSIRLPSIGGSGYFQATKIAAGGAYIAQGTILIHQATKFTYQVVVSATYFDGDAIPIEGVSKGPDTNLDADAPLLFDSQPAGCSPGGVVLAQNDGTGVLVGLTGGHDAETDEELQDRVIEAQSNPPADRNSARLVQVAQKTGGVPIVRAFAYPGWFGSGSSAVAFLLRSDVSSTQLPNGTQIGLVEQNVRSVFATDDSITVVTVLGTDFNIALGVTWISNARGWSDLTPFPQASPSDPLVVDGTAAISSTAFRVKTTSTSITAPQVGQTIALYDASTKTFKRKRIATVATIIAGRKWALTFETALNVSDVFVPTGGALVSPFASSMQRLIAPILSYVRTLGPGEMFSSLPDPGGRQRRWPFSPDTWPSVVTNEGLVNAAKASGLVSDTEVLLPSTPHTTPVGTPGVLVYRLQMKDFAVYPQT